MEVPEFLGNTVARGRNLLEEWGTRRVDEYPFPAFRVFLERFDSVRGIDGGFAVSASYQEQENSIRFTITLAQLISPTMGGWSDRALTFPARSACPGK